MNRRFHEDKLRMQVYRFATVLGWIAVAAVLIILPTSVWINDGIGDATGVFLVLLMFAIIPIVGLCHLTGETIELWGDVKAMEEHREAERIREAERVIRDYERKAQR